MPTSLRVANASGFYGDRFDAMHEMLTGGDIDVLTGDYLAELTMLILAMDRLKDPTRGYASTFLRQMEGCLGPAMDAGVKVVVNAGGLNPAGLAGQLRDLSTRLGVPASVAHVEGDDLLARADELGFGAPLAANAYLGAWGIAAALDAGADVVVTGRVTDASLVVGPAAAHFGWTPDDLDQLAGAVVAGHVIECGTQASGGNFARFTEIPDMVHPGFPARRDPPRRLRGDHQARPHRRRGHASTPSPRSCSTRSVAHGTRDPMSPPASTPCSCTRTGPTGCGSPAPWASRRHPRSRWA